MDSMIADKLVSQLEGVRSTGQDRWIARCPAHDDRSPSLSIREVDDRILIAKGYATAASLHEATDDATVVAFDAGNLKPVAESIRNEYPDVEIIVCADNDDKTPGNPGVTKAKEAAFAIKGKCAVPGISGDFNDLATSRGPLAVMKAVATAGPVRSTWRLPLF